MHPPPSPDDALTAPVRRVGAAALQSLAIAAELLSEAARTLGSDSGADGLHDAVDAVAARIPRLEDSQRGVADALFVAAEIVHFCDVLASRHRSSSPAALGCARLAEAGAQLALEALTEERGWTDVQGLSRRARQLVAIQEMRRRLDAMAATVALHGVAGTSEGRFFRGELRRAIDDSDPALPHA